MKPLRAFLVLWTLVLIGGGILSVATALTAAPATSDPDTAVLTRLAEDGNEGAQIQIAIHLLDGTAGFEKSPGLAALWFERAAMQGNAYAQMRLADLYVAGTGVARNLRVAADWREKAANRGNTDAQLKLGSMYLDGDGVERNPLRGEYWIERASIEGNAEARARLANLRHQRAIAEGVSPELKRALATETYEQAVRLVHLLDYPEFRIEEAWYHRIPELRKLAEDGDLQAQFVIGTHYLQGSCGKVRDVDRAARAASMPK